MESAIQTGSRTHLTNIAQSGQNSNVKSAKKGTIFKMESAPL